ncbi:MAG: hypothetical protein GY864_11835 [Desulfobacterales bacterium]|nr:hypothetical protein [Desulfobacterales bacterium]
MEAFIVIPEQTPHIPDIFSEAGKEAGGKEGFPNFMAQLPENIEKDLKAHSIYLSDLKKKGKLLFAGVTDDFKDAFIVYAAENLEEAKKLAENDPFMKNRLFTGYRIRSLHHWL